MLNEGNFHEKLVSMINEPEQWSKEEYYSAFLDMTERFYNALIASLEYENVILEKFGEDVGEALIEKIATSNPSLMDMEDEKGEKDTAVWVAFEILADTTPELGDIVPRAINLLDGGRIAFLARLEEMADN